MNLYQIFDVRNREMDGRTDIWTIAMGHCAQQMHCIVVLLMFDPADKIVHYVMVYCSRMLESVFARSFVTLA